MMTSVTIKTKQAPKGAGKPATWPVAEAKARLSELIERTLSEGPQTITRQGRETVVMVSAAEWERKTRRKGNLAEFFAASPLRHAELKIERGKEKPREIEL
jgi:prevent-host-death family protein